MEELLEKQTVSQLQLKTVLDLTIWLCWKTIKVFVTFFAAKVILGHVFTSKYSKVHTS